MRSRLQHVHRMGQSEQRRSDQCFGSYQPDFTLLANPSSVSVTQGSQVNTSITVTPQDDFTGSVTLSASGLPSGVTANFNPNPITGSSTLTLTATDSAATGTVTVKILGTSGNVTDSTLLVLSVNQLVQDFTLSASPSSITVAKSGASGQSAITITQWTGSLATYR